MVFVKKKLRINNIDFVLTHVNYITTHRSQMISTAVFFSEHVFSFVVSINSGKENDGLIIINSRINSMSFAQNIYKKAGDGS